MGASKPNFLVIAPNYFNYATSTVKAIRQLGYNVKFFAEKPFYLNCSYLQRKLFKMGFTSIKNAWDKRWNSDLLQFIHENADKNTKLMFLTGGAPAEVLMLLTEYDKILVLWDSIRRSSLDQQQRVQMYDKVYAFEYNDLAYMQETFGIKNMEYLPVGYDDGIYFPDDRQQKDIDVSFVGTYTEERFSLFEEIAQCAYRNHWKLAIYGQWVNLKWPWMKWKFKKNHPVLFRSLNNYNILPEKTAMIYRRSKIVLNINNTVHKSISPRTFEILATGAFQLMNKGQESHGTIDLEKDLVLYDSVGDLAEKINYYLSCEKERMTIAERGYRDCQRFSLTNLLRRVVDGSC